MGVDIGGLVWIKKDGNCLAQQQGASQAKVVRNSKLLGDFNYGHASLDDVVMGLAITNAGDRDGSLMNKVGQINGAFKIEVIAQFDNVSSAVKMWQRVSDFGNGLQQDSVLLAQCESSNDLCLVVYKDSKEHRLRAGGAITEGEMANFLVGIDADGTWWIEKNGTRIAERQGIIPKNVQRNKNYIGTSA